MIQLAAYDSSNYQIFSRYARDECSYNLEGVKITLALKAKQLMGSCSNLAYMRAAAAA